MLTIVPKWSILLVRRSHGFTSLVALLIHFLLFLFSTFCFFLALKSSFPDELDFRHVFVWWNIDVNIIKIPGNFLGKDSLKIWNEIKYCLTYCLLFNRITIDFEKVFGFNHYYCKCRYYSRFNLTKYKNFWFVFTLLEFNFQKKNAFCVNGIFGAFARSKMLAKVIF